MIYDINRLMMILSGISAMHRVGSAGNTSNSTRPRKEKRLTYVLNDADDMKVMFCFHSFIPSSILHVL